MLICWLPSLEGLYELNLCPNRQWGFSESQDLSSSYFHTTTREDDRTRRDPVSFTSRTDHPPAPRMTQGLASPFFGHGRWLPRGSFQQGSIELACPAFSPQAFQPG